MNPTLKDLAHLNPGQEIRLPLNAAKPEPSQHYSRRRCKPEQAHHGKAMRKIFELLHIISNEKELFETLEGWEDLPKTAAEGAMPSPQADEKERGSTPLETGLPDVFQTEIGRAHV